MTRFVKIDPNHTGTDCRRDQITAINTIIYSYIDIIEGIKLQLSTLLSTAILILSEGSNCSYQHYYLQLYWYYRKDQTAAINTIIYSYIDIIGRIKLQLSTLLSTYIDIMGGIKLQLSTVDSESLHRIHTNQFSNPIKNFHFSIVQYSHCVIMSYNAILMVTCTLHLAE